MKTKDVMDSFVHGGMSSPSKGSVTIHGDRLYSYGEIICRRNGDVFVLVEPNRSSTTTVKHMNMIYNTLLNERKPFSDNTIHCVARVKRELVNGVKRVELGARDG